MTLFNPETLALRRVENHDRLPVVDSSRRASYETLTLASPQYGLEDKQFEGLVIELNRALN